MGKFKKTLAMRALDNEKIQYEHLTYDVKDGLTDGVSVASKVGIDPKQVFKTLVTVGSSKTHYVFVIPVEKHLDLKRAAVVAGEKKIEMIPVKDILKITGYVKGGCSPLSMKKTFKTFVDEDAKEYSFMVFSGGKIGVQIKMIPKELVNTFNMNWFSME